MTEKDKIIEEGRKELEKGCGLEGDYEYYGEHNQFCGKPYKEYGITYCPHCSGKIKGFDIAIKIIQSQKQKIIEEIENLPNPYPLDIFPKVELDGYETEMLNIFLKTKLHCSLDRLSAELMRRARETCKLEILKVIGEKYGKNNN